MRYGILALATIMALSACHNNMNSQEKIEREAKTQATQAGTVIAALGLTELELLDADILDPANLELADVVKVERDASGKVDRLLVEIEGSKPDRFVHIPISELKPVVRGNDTDLQTNLTAAQLRALPEVKLNAQ